MHDIRLFTVYNVYCILTITRLIQHLDENLPELVIIFFILIAPLLCVF